MDKIDSTTPADGCPSGLQDIPIQTLDPMGGHMDITPYVTHISDNKYSINLIIQGAHCAGCVAKIERGVSDISGVTQARMNLSTLRLNVAWTGGKHQANDILSALRALGFGAAPYELDTAQAQSQSEIKFLLRTIAVAGFAVMNVMLLSIAVWSGGTEMSLKTQSMFHWISALIALPTVAYSGQPFFRSAWSALKNRHTNMDVPISLAIILACSLSLYETIMGNPHTYFDAAVMLLFLLLIGRYLDARLRLRTGEAARRLAALQVTSATIILPSGDIKTVPETAIRPGDHLMIPAGQRLPVDCTILSGTSDIDRHIATGETEPRLFGPGDALYSGTTNLTHPLTVEAVALSSHSFLSEITKLVEAGEQSKSRFVKIADRAARIYVPFVHSIAALTFLGWLLWGADFRTATLSAIAVLIITCPCALGLAVPAVHIVAAGRLFKNGILIRSGDAFERLAKTKTVIFDKTGTLTLGRFTLQNQHKLTPQQLKYAAALAIHSNHPVARALHAFHEDCDASHVSEHAGGGLRGIIDQTVVMFGSAKFVNAPSTSEGSSQSWLKIGDAAPIVFQFEDCPRDSAPDTIAQLKAQGLTIELLSGDQQKIAKKTAQDLGIDQWQGEVTPQQKMDLLKKRRSDGHYPLMVGDGINDAPAMTSAYSSASPATAADVARSAADIILQGDKLSGLPIAIRIARHAHRRVAENLTLAIVYNMIAIPLAIFGFVNPLVAALAMSGSSLLVTLNALRMARS